MQDRHLCCPPYFFLGPAVPPHFLILESPLFNRVNHSKSIFIATESHHAGETYMLDPLIFSLAPQWLPQFFQSRIATASVPGNAARQWLLIAVSHSVERNIYTVWKLKRNIADNEFYTVWKVALLPTKRMHFLGCWRNMGHFLCGAERVKRYVNVYLHCIVRSLKCTEKCRLCLPVEKMSADAHVCVVCVYNLTSGLYFAINNNFCIILVPLVAAYRLACHWMCGSPRTGYARRLTTMYMWREQAKT